MIQQNTITSFRKFIWDFYHNQGRSFAWRNSESFVSSSGVMADNSSGTMAEHVNPYHVVVSEIMLQQTQTYRVEPKYEQFIELFPDFETLACAPLRSVLSAWQGLGYNRRGKYLQQIAQKVVVDFNGVLPDDPNVLETFPGIGKGTAGSICAFAFNKPTIFIETNIRTVFIHSFFQNQDTVHDKELLPLIAQTVDIDNPREWYYALMDYGVHLKKLHANPSRKSKHHSKQSKFEGSDRQIRGMIIKMLTEHPSLDHGQLFTFITKDLSADLSVDLFAEAGELRLTILAKEEAGELRLTILAKEEALPCPPKLLATAGAKEEEQRVVRILGELQREQLIECKDERYCIVG